VNIRSGTPLGINALLFTILFVTLLAYLAIWSWVIWQIWTDDATEINSAAIYAGSALGGTLSGFFAFTLGIRKTAAATQPAQLAGTVNTPPQMALGITIASGSREEIAFTLITTLAIWSYAIVGAAAIATVFFRSGSSPESVKAIASAFIGLVFALFNQVFQSPD
jgi:RsiW-degrading membrane proteinase PrsW (M82 family)